MKKISLSIYILVLTVIYSCSTPRLTDINRIIVENKSMWIESWINDPLLNLSTDGWKLYKNEYSYVFTKIPAYELFYFYSPSKEKFVDIYSRKIDIEITKNDTSIIFIGEPDSEIILSDIKRKTSDRLLFVGSETYFDDLLWIDDSCFIVLGYFTDFNSLEICPEIMIFDIKRQQRICYKGTANKIKFNYISKKFGNFNFIFD